MIVLLFLKFWSLILCSVFCVRRLTFSKFQNSSADSQNINMCSTAEVFRQKLLWTRFLSVTAPLWCFTHVSLTCGLSVGSGNAHCHLLRYTDDYFDTSTSDLSEPSLYLLRFFRCSRCFLNLWAFIPPNISWFSMLVKTSNIQNIFLSSMSCFWFPLETTICTTFLKIHGNNGKLQQNRSYQPSTG